MSNECGCKKPAFFHGFDLHLCWDCYEKWVNQFRFTGKKVTEKVTEYLF